MAGGQRGCDWSPKRHWRRLIAERYHSINVKRITGKGGSKNEAEFRLGPFRDRDTHCRRGAAGAQAAVYQQPVPCEPEMREIGIAVAVGEGVRIAALRHELAQAARLFL